MLCFNVTKVMTTKCLLRQLFIPDNAVDREVFDLIRKEYHIINGQFKRHLSMRALAQVDFIKVR